MSIIVRYGTVRFCASAICYLLLVLCMCVHVHPCVFDPPPGAAVCAWFLLLSPRSLLSVLRFPLFSALYICDPRMDAALILRFSR